MNTEQDNFDSLQRLLALKRHEQPPPGYFERFSGNVIARIRVGEAATKRSFLDRLFEEAPWIQQLCQTFEHRPLFAGACSFAVCGLIAASVMYSDVPTSPNLGTVAGHVGEVVPWSSHEQASVSFVDFSLTNGLSSSSIRGGSLFDEVRESQASPQRASFQWAY
jgi:hypothetical protein